MALYSNPQDGSHAALAAAKNKVFSDKNFKQLWDSVLAADKAILSMIANGTTDLHSKLAMQQLGAELGLEGSVNKNTTHNALRRLSNKNIVTKIEYGIYQFEDEAFAEWVKYLE